MTYSDLFVKKKFQIPTLVSVVIVLLIILVLSKLFITTSIPSKASKQNIKRLEISNIFWNQATIFWQSNQKETGWVVFGTDPNNLTQVALDEKALDPNKEKFVNHYAILKNLKESSQYYFRLVQSNQLIGKENGAPFNFKTISKSDQINNLQPAYGKVINQNSLPVENAIVLLSVKNSYPLSTLSKLSGEWLIPLNYIIDSSTQRLKTISNSEDVKIEVLAEDGQISMVNALVGNLSPVSETISIGKNYNFLGNSVLSASTKAPANIFPIEIVFPKDNAIVPSNNPLIKGTALPNSTGQVTVYEEKKTFSQNVQTENNGVWTLALSQPLAQGKHTLFLKTKDADGNEIIKTRNFTITKSGEQVLGEATPEATPTTISPTKTPPTTVTPAPSTSLTPPATVLTPTPPVTGGGLYFFTIASLTLVTLGLGLILLF